MGVHQPCVWIWLQLWMPFETLVGHCKASKQTALFPVLTNFKHTSPCHWKATKIRAFKENYHQPAQVDRLRTVKADSQVDNCDRFSYQQVIRLLQHCELRNELDFNRHKGNYKSFPQLPGHSLIPSQYISLDEPINNSVQSKPVVPGRGILD